MEKHDTLIYVPIENLVRGHYQPRQHFDEKKLRELAETIKTMDGLLQPLVVRKRSDGKYEIIAGERRWRAAMLAGKDTLACLVKSLNDQEALEAAIIENVSRSDLNPIEEAQAYQRLLDEFGYTHEAVAKSVGKSRTKITNSLRMLRLEPRVQAFLVEGTLSEGHGKILAGLPNHLQFDLAQQIVKHNWSVRRIEQEIKLRLSPEISYQRDPNPNIQTLERALSDHIGCEVKIEYLNKKGKLHISFPNLEVLDGILEKMGFQLDS